MRIDSDTDFEELVLRHALTAGYVTKEYPPLDLMLDGQRQTVAISWKLAVERRRRAG